MKTSLKERLLAYFKKQPTAWVASGTIQRIVAENTSYSPSNASRRLRELCEEGELEVKYEKGHAHYRIRQRIDDVVWFDNLP